ncbi:N,N-dimethylformamidase large subunit [Agrobacterium vitis]|uniref:N,N-dimethylformamidase beta subunit family domain-containing protein n=1 Tax=Rhizobium/Agrobacterium group TaxID=227290 RepID=UPI0012E92B31|nr:MULTISPECIES: N,N-dimethylformamidase beta subunit family domain-containing protein [Rhizobium/Agrobacterium group]MCF1495763.1 N,N-dimethylformamidase large subunit [Allorhizobium ampelinum]MVA45802.1 N,N-dimethylformamidase large subunit [Agrobacterium vitis]
MSIQDHKPPGVIGYVTPLSARPGERLDFKISSLGDRAITANVMRLDCCDPNPLGPGLKSEQVEFGLSAVYPAREQKTYLGSCAFGALPTIPVTQDLTVELTVRPGFVSATDQTIFSLQDNAGTTGVALIIRNGRLFLKNLRSPAQLEDLDLSLKLKAWCKLEVSFSDGDVSMRTSHIGTSKIEEASRSFTGMRGALVGVDHICLAALWNGHPKDCYNGTIEAPRLSVASQEAPESGRTIIAQWPFTDSGNSEWVSDDIDPSLGLQLINLPMRAVRSSSWTGQHMDWKVAPEEYAAITFHSDDLSDCAWETTIALTVPDGMPSGVYGLVIDNEIATDTIPFYVLPGANSQRQKIVFLAPTFTYMAYANHARGNFAGPLEARVKDWGAYPHNPEVVGSFGYSTYNRHPDGTGVTISSRLRPIMTMRPGYLVYFDERGSGMRGFPADSHLTDWLTTKGFAFDVLTDEDLDRDGVDALSPYDVVLTGSHPEYHTRRTIDAILAYRQAGGRLMYLGGNGFYWKIGRDQTLPHILELRRAEGGMRVWASKPGEYYNQLDGEYGGLWRRNGIPPQAVAGVGFTAEGNFEGTYYLRTNESFAEELAFLFEGISADERLGDFGLSGGGAAGFEIDQACTELGTPEFVTVVAASEGHGSSFETTYEELLTPGVIDGGPRPYGGMRSNIVYGLDENGGGLFSVGSITFCGSLSHNGYDNNISRLLENCLRKFLSTPRRAGDPHAPSSTDTIPPIGSHSHDT